MLKKLFLVLLVILLSVSIAHAGRKKSFIGSLVDSAKEGASAVKQDIENYNTFSVTLDITNFSNADHPVTICSVEKDVYNPGYTCKDIIFDKRITANSSHKEVVELGTAYVGQRKFMLKTYLLGHKYDDYIFNPAKEDYFDIKIK